MSNVASHHLIAIGASAGGLDELYSFFDRTPPDGVSYVIIQHLSADFKSRMAELLAKHSRLSIKEVENGMPVKSNEVYLIPSDQYMIIRGSKLYLTEKGKGQSPHMTINRFFNSLADDYGAKAIGVILSGLGSDGTEGIKAIKKVGGLVIVRDPENSDFNSMPSSAVATGLADFVLEPEMMPVAIEDFVKFGEGMTADPEDDKNIVEIIDLIKAKSPLDFSDYKQTTILRRTKRRAAYANFTSLRKYLDFLKTSPEEIEALGKDFMISVTSFFRDKEAFEFIQKKIIPDLKGRLAPAEELKVWVAGCATGEEVYSLAILIHEQLAESKNNAVKIFATDIDKAALLHAGKGLYSRDIIKNVSAERLDKYFFREENHYRVKPVIRKMVIFARHDLVKNPPYCNMHFISCRNLLIYMTPVLQKKVFSMLLFGLKVNGYLFLGASENPLSIIKSLETVHKKWKLYRNLETKKLMGLDTFLLPEFIEPGATAGQSSANEAKKINPNMLTEAVNASLLAENDRLVICVDEHDQVIQTYGDTTRYLLQKNFNSKLLELLPRPLLIAYSTSSKKAVKTRSRVVVKGVKFISSGVDMTVNVSVTPLIIGRSASTIRMITIVEEKNIQVHPGENLVFDENILAGQYMLDLEAEVKELKEKLHTAQEQLDASNENLQSFNEELLSSNEEMQSTNEEMQSVNEELETINASYQLTNKELLELNDDLNNYFRSNINGQLFIDEALRLLKFSPGAVKLINLLESDIGRPLSNISTNIKFETILEDAKLVIANGATISKEIETKDDHWYQIMTMPYLRQAANRHGGAIITFNDITELKQTQLELDKKNETLQRINADLDHFIYAASHDLLAPLGNIEASINVVNTIPLSEPELLEFLNVINGSVKKFRQLITEVATIARVEADMAFPEPVDLNEIIDNIQWSLEDKIADSNAVITRNLKIASIQFSKKNLRSILYNLISNSIKFRSQESPAIKITTKLVKDIVVLTVEDNGIGIAPEYMKKIFDMYGRLDHGIEGQGIGLYLINKIINAAKGTLKVESEPGKGTRFSIYLSDSP